ncbi:LUD domain-containing protein [Salinigranum salinum]|uniref:LUD domain-containing protein n=1 Tax=Salinigranum salinum TaxID=1364937 RepID=UPI001260AE86|nr:LUD domain-containing protein [Salinigranum salinum]
MAAESMDALEASLQRQGTELTRTTGNEFATTLADAVVEPAVGTDLSALGLSYGDAPVTVDPTPKELLAAHTGVTDVRHAIASYGTLALPSDARGTEPVSLYPERHVAVVPESVVVPDVATALDRVGDDFDVGDDSLVLATGPSATGDMGALVYGVHGPTEIHVVLVTDR